MESEETIYIEDLKGFEKAVYEQSKLEGYTVGLAFGLITGFIGAFAAVATSLILGGL